MVTGQQTQTAGNRRGDPIRGAVKKGRHWLEAGRGHGLVLELTPSTYWTCPAGGYFSLQVEWLPADSERVTCRSAVSQDRVIFNLFMTCQYRHQGKVTVTVALSSLWVCTWEPVNTSWQMTPPIQYINFGYQYDILIMLTQRKECNKMISSWRGAENLRVTYLFEANQEWTRSISTGGACIIQSNQLLIRLVIYALIFLRIRYYENASPDLLRCSNATQINSGGRGLIVHKSGGPPTKVSVGVSRSLVCRK